MHGLAACCSSTARCWCRRSWLQDRKRPSRRLPVVLTPDGFASSVFWKASIVCSPSFCMERAWISEGLQLRVKDLDFDHGTIIVREGGSRSGLDVTPRAWHPACASSCRVHGHGG